MEWLLPRMGTDVHTKLIHCEREATGASKLEYIQLQWTGFINDLRTIQCNSLSLFTGCYYWYNSKAGF